MLTGRLKNELIGVKLKVVTNYLINNNPIIHDYLIYAVYPHCVSAIRFAENGTQVTRSFSEGDLVTMGVLSGRAMNERE